MQTQKIGVWNVQDAKYRLPSSVLVYTKTEWNKFLSTGKEKAAVEEFSSHLI